MEPQNTEQPMAHAHLNDLAVSILEQNCFHQAFDAYKDALKTLKRGFNESSNSSFNFSASSFSYTAGSLGTSCSSLDTTFSRTGALEPFPNAPPINYASFSIENLTSAEGVDSVFEKLRDDDLSEETFLSIQFAEIKVPRKVAAAIIKYNLGIAHRAYARALLSKGRQVASTNQVNLATKHFRSAETYMSKVSVESTTMTAYTGDESSRQILLLHLTTLLALHKQVVETPEEDEVQDKLIRLNAQIEAMFTVCKMPRSDAAIFHLSPRRTVKSAVSKNCKSAVSA